MIGICNGVGHIDLKTREQTDEEPFQTQPFERPCAQPQAKHQGRQHAADQQSHANGDQWRQNRNPRRDGRHLGDIDGLAAHLQRNPTDRPLINNNPGKSPAGCGFARCVKDVIDSEQRSQLAMVCRIEVRVDDREVISDAAEKDLG